MPKIVKYSVIIPAYNAEETITRCLESLISQKRNDVEIIVVNDGSTDNTLNIIRLLAEQNEAIICIDQINGGVSKARNVGLEYATGEYVTFVDSDDYVTENYFSVLDSMDYDADICYFQTMTTDGSEKKETELFHQVKLYSEWPEKMKVLLLSRVIMNPFNKRFKLQIIRKNGLNFIENLHISEDFNFCLAYSMYCSTIQVYFDCIYCVDLQNDNSLSRKMRPNLTVDINDAFNYASTTIRESNISNMDKEKLLVALDYLYVKNVCTCIAEKFKFKSPSYLKYRAEYKEICKVFNTSLGSGNEYCGFVHRLLRVFLKCNFTFPFYFVSWAVKNRKYKKYRK